MTIDPESIRKAVRRLEEADPYRSMFCDGCRKDVKVPEKASYVVCGCGHVLIDGATEVKS